ncbi:MFS transporter [Burkholderia cepacia]|nr:MFS transporter [Burkholderia cepacia]KWD55083.1 MFS transporter [Burkholderia cepacia]KWD87075.1 MFS transporter [Burkholderia cepacia]
MKSRVDYRWIIATVLFVAYSIQFLDRVKTNLLNPLIAADIGMSAADIGTGTFLMLIFYGPSQYVSGVLTDKYGAKKMLIFSVISWSLMTAWMGFLHTRNEYFIRMALFGILVGTEYVPSARVLMRWFNKEGRARAQALLSWAWILTPAWASIFATQLAAHTGSWRLVFFISGALGVIPLALIAYFVFDRPEQYPRITQAELEYSYKDEIEAGVLDGKNFSDVQRRILKVKHFSFLDLFRHPAYIAVVVVDVVMQVTYWGASIWIPIYLADKFGFEIQTMGLWAGLYFVAGAIGSFVSSYLSDKVFRGNRRIMIATCFAGLIPFLLVIATLRDGNQQLLAFALCGMGFFANMAWGPFLTVPAEIFTPEVYGKAMGFVNGVGYVVAAFSAKIFASLIVTTSAGKDYSNGWIFLAGCVLVGILASWFIRIERNDPARTSANEPATT